MVKYIIIAIIFIVLAATAFHLFKVHSKNKEELNNYKEHIELTNNLGKVLVVYYSYSNGARTKDIAQRIQKQTGADIYEIKTKKPMPGSAKIYISSKQELKNKTYPELVTDFPDFNNYDIIFVGAPVWWYTMATPLYSFLQIADFNGKKVVPFSTQGSNYGTFFEDFNKEVKNAVVLKSENFNNVSKEYDNMVDNKITSWLNSL